MPARPLTIKHRFAGGWATDYGTYIDVGVSQGGVVEIPFLLDADNLYYELDGAPHKIGGSTKYNATALESGDTITGIYDHWQYAASASPTQTIVCTVNDKLYDLTNGANIHSSLTDGAVPDFTTFGDLLIYATDQDAPRSYNVDTTTDQALSGSPPNFSFSEVHKNRVFAAGVAASTSTLYWCAAEDPEDWTGLGSGQIQVSPDDGDAITAIKSHRGELFIFKGPHRGSIWRLQGSAPNSSDPFRLVPFLDRIGCVSQRMAFRVGNDLVFMHIDGSIHRLADTAAVAGQYQMASMSLPINTYLRDRVVSDRLKYASAAPDEQRGYVVFSLTVDSGIANNMMLLMDFRFDPPRWARLPKFSAVSTVASVIDSAADDRPRILTGSSDGFVRRFDQKTRTIDTDDPYFYNWKTPWMNYGDPFETKELSALSASIVPKGNYPIVFRWRRDDNPSQQVDLDQKGGDVLAPTTQTPFTLNTSVLGGGNGREAYADLVEGGQFRRIQYQALNAGVGQDAEVHNFSVRLRAGGVSLEN